MNNVDDLISNHDFSGWATRNNLRCSDGRMIMENAFAHNDGQIVPLVWMHDHSDPSKVLGKVLLRNEKEGVRAYGKFNDSDSGQYAKELVHSGDVTGLSIYANQLQQKVNGNTVAVMHGDIKEVSLVLAGANPGAYIDSDIVHGEFSDEAAFIGTGLGIQLEHSDELNEKNEKNEGENDMANDQNQNQNDETIADVFNTLTEKQKTAVYAIVGQLLEENDDDDDDEENNKDNESNGGNNSMKHNAFENDNVATGNALSHSDMKLIFDDAKKSGSLKTAYEDYLESSYISHDDASGGASAGIQNEDGTYVTYGMSNVGYLFPEAQPMNGGTPEFIKRNNGWVDKVMSGVHHTPFARIKSVFADITGDEARAKGYVKGNRKKDEVFALLKRRTNPTTVYKKQKMDRDDITDITDFDVVAWIKAEMRLMLDEEFARAYIFGDGRNASLDDKIDENCIRPVISDDDLYTIKATIEGTTDTEIASNIIDGIVSAQDTYQGSGNLTALIPQTWVTKMLLLKDSQGYRLYKSIDELATAMSVKEVVKVPDAIVPKGSYGVVLDLGDYNVGADKGGAVNLFDDFDIDYNQYAYLIESRCSGALTKPYSAIALNAKNA